MSNEQLESNQPHITKDALAEMVKEIFAKPQEFADHCRNMPTKLVIYLLVLTVCAMIQMIFHSGKEEQNDPQE